MIPVIRWFQETDVKGIIETLFQLEITYLPKIEYRGFVGKSEFVAWFSNLRPILYSIGYFPKYMKIILHT